MSVAVVAEPKAIFAPATPVPKFNKNTTQGGFPSAPSTAPTGQTSGGGVSSTGASAPQSSTGATASRPKGFRFKGSTDKTEM